MKAKYFSGLCCLWAMASVLGGCVSTIAVKYEPATEPRPITKGRQVKLFMDKLVDEHAPGDMSSAGGCVAIHFSPPFADGLREALLVELKRLGLLAAQTSGEADATLGVTIKTAKFVTGEGSIAGTETAMNLIMLLALKDQRQRELWSGEITGHATVYTGWNGGSAPWLVGRRVLNAGVADALTKIGPLFEAEDVVSKIFAPPPASTKLAAAPKEEAAPSHSSQQTPERIIHSDIDDLPAARTTARPKSHAVVIGVRRYRQKLPEADFADSDARLVSKYLTQAMGFPKQNVATLLNDQAQKSDFEKYFEQWLPNRVEKGDEVFVFYSGHGAPNPTTGDAYLVPFDGDPTYLQETAYPLKKMYAALASLPTKRVTVVMDSCFSGAGGRSVLAKGARPLVTSAAAGSIPPNLTVLTASAGDQITYAYDEKGHGLFTYFFLKGIKEKTGAGSLNMKEIFDWAAPQVSRVARREYNNDQVPQWQGSQP